MSVAPAVSVVVPTHNRRDTVVSTVRELFAQHAVDLEIVVVDDGSTDGTSEALEALGDPRVRVVRHPRALGQSRARDAGVAAARAEWVAFLDDDDRWAPDKLRRQLDAAAAANADFVYCTAVTASVTGTVFDHLPAPDPDALRRLIRAYNVIPAGSSNVLVRADLLQRVGGFDPALTHLADWDVWIRLTEAGQAAVCPEPLVAYILHETNIHLDQSGLASEARHLRAKHARSSLPGQLDRAALDGWRGWAHQRRGSSLTAARFYLAAAVRSRRASYLPAVASALLEHLRVRRPKVRELVPPDWLARSPAR
ncbi:glycosyltransferase [Solirubrobacter sp. CPCC 204708]|uniref:Glycosyltransferase n=1 Tax=Solirubrobacter deserti TaxID=2282478 RepID=A0ABT4RM69_9ACTN|nr:glycosyltransferase [Solirubrobacter deserti]MBE2317957.1 glycosyltransferase [Solirubrobacter deserti]MDA0139636.1 glycosyltransferase [Solirubrobacter deserti]